MLPVTEGAFVDVTIADVRAVDDGRALALTVTVHELAPHIVGASATPPYRCPAAAGINDDDAVVRGTPVESKTSRKFRVTDAAPVAYVDTQRVGDASPHAADPDAGHTVVPNPRRPPLQRVTFA